MSWFLARTLGFSLPLTLIVYISEEVLGKYFLLVQSIQVLGLIISAGFTSFIIDLDRSKNWLLSVKGNLKIFIILIVFLVGSCLVLWLTTKGNFVFYISGAVLFGCRLFFQTLMRKYYEETHVILATDISYSFVVLTLLLIGIAPEISILIALLINFIVLLVMSRTTLPTNAVPNCNLELASFFKRSWTFGIQSTVVPALVLIYIFSVEPNDIIEVKLAFMTCTGVHWLQSSVKSFYLRSEHSTFRHAIKVYRFRIIFVFSITILLYSTMAIAMLFFPGAVSNKVELGVLSILALSFFSGNVVIFATVVALQNSQWKLYAGRGSGTLAAFMLLLVLVAFVMVSYFRELWAIGLSYNLYCLVISAVMFGLTRKAGSSQTER